MKFSFESAFMWFQKVKYNLMYYLGNFISGESAFLFNSELLVKLKSHKKLDDTILFNIIWKSYILLPFSTICLKLDNIKVNYKLCRFIFVKFVCFVLDLLSMDLFTDW